MNTKRKAVGIAGKAVALLTALLMLAGAAPAQAATESDGVTASEHAKIQRLVFLNEGTTYEGMLADLQSAADAAGVSFDEVLDSAAMEAEAANSDYQRTRRLSSSSSSSGGDSTKHLNTARYVGDVFYGPNSLAGVHHGHTGIYSTKITIIHAPGGGSPSEEKPISQVYVATPIQLMSVSTTSSKRGDAVAKARGYVGRPYNNNFAVNRNEGKSMNCSQLVWAAYYYGASIDLDYNGGFGVYPSDILNSSLTHTYEYIN